MKLTCIDRPIEPLIGSKEAASILGFSSLTIRRMAHRGELPSYSFPSGKNKFRYFYRVSELEIYLDSLRRQPVQKQEQVSEEDVALRAS